MPQFKKRNILFFILLLSIFSLFAAYFIEYILGYQPCNLCIVERIPYFLAIFIIFLILVFKKYEKIYLLILSSIFIAASILSFYHFGIEQGFFEESFVCDLDNKMNNLTTEELLKELKKKTISCKDVSFRILGLSLATINTIISLGLAYILIKIFKNYEKNR